MAQGGFSKIKIFALIFTFTLLFFPIINGSGQTEYPSLDLLGQYDTIQATSMAISGNVAAVSARIPGDEFNYTHQIYILDITDPNNIIVSAEIAENSRYVSMYQNYLYIYLEFSNPGVLAVYDISIPCKPNFIHNVPFSGAAKIEIIDNYMLVPGSPDVTIYLLDDPSTPVEISSFQENLGDQGYSGEDLDKLGDFITIASSDEGFYLVKFDGFNLEHLQTFRLTRNNDIALGASLLPNNLLVLSSFQAIMVYNISDPNAPTLIVEKEL